MRQAFLIGAIMLWVGLNILGGIGELQVPLQQVDSETGLTQEETLSGMQHPEITDVNILTVFTKVWDFLKLVGAVIFLWHPVLWQGSAMYIYYFLILPIGVSFWAVFLMALRGTGSS
jgi:hypothetical protein